MPEQQKKVLEAESNPHYTEANFEMIIYGPVINPQVTIGTNTYLVNIVLESGWEEGDVIRQVWKLVDDPVYPMPEPTPEERISNLETTTDALKSTSDDIILMMADIIGG